MKTLEHSWKISGPHILTNHKGEYDGEGWHVVRKSPTGGMSAHEWVLDRQGLVKYFRTEREARRRADNLNKYI